MDPLELKQPTLVEQKHVGAYYVRLSLHRRCSARLIKTFLLISISGPFAIHFYRYSLLLWYKSVRMAEDHHSSERFDFERFVNNIIKLPSQIVKFPHKS